MFFFVFLWAVVCALSEAIFEQKLHTLVSTYLSVVVGAGAACFSIAFYCVRVYGRVICVGERRTAALFLALASSFLCAYMG
jgi:uncharacterized membrane protein YccF (DUF307 family)